VWVLTVSNKSTSCDGKVSQISDDTCMIWGSVDKLIIAGINLIHDVMGVKGPWKTYSFMNCCIYQVLCLLHYSDTNHFIN